MQCDMCMLFRHATVHVSVCTPLAAFGKCSLTVTSYHTQTYPLTNVYIKYLSLVMNKEHSTSHPHLHAQTTHGCRNNLQPLNNLQKVEQLKTN